MTKPSLPLNQSQVACFVAGTLVRTRDGLVPIEQLKVGDWVLSQPENTGPRTCKRVLNTFRFEGQGVYRVKSYSASALAASGEGPIPIDQFQALVVTGNHPFWVRGLGWTRADCLEGGHELELPDGQAAFVASVDKIHRTVTEKVGWVRGVGIDDDHGRLVDLRGAQPVFGHERVMNEGVEWWEEGNRLRMAVYNLEVEDNHSYYVGADGVWVHNSGCGERPCPDGR